MKEGQFSVTPCMDMLKAIKEIFHQGEVEAKLYPPPFQLFDHLIRYPWALLPLILSQSLDS